jgi:hypothetical protein
VADLLIAVILPALVMRAFFTTFAQLPAFPRATDGAIADNKIGLTPFLAVFCMVVIMRCCRWQCDRKLRLTTSIGGNCIWVVGEGRVGEGVTRQ